MNAPTPTLHLISSMATKQVLADLAAAYEAISPVRVRVESVGGVDATRRVQAGEVFDAVVLARATIDQLAQAGFVQAGSAVDFVRVGVYMAVREGELCPPVHDEAAVKAAVLAAPSVSYSTGPSGVHLARLFERWGIAQTIAPRLVQAAPGVPVGGLVASGQVALGFQQHSELIHLPGITLLGPLPDSIQTITTFTAAVCTRSAHAAETAALLRYLAASEGAAIKQACGMEPA